ncbi:MAG: DUF1638 domain-containing protein [Spirochaetaceae bacterium]|jgi:hypothetical protein|nr:DUF1638 domain-containing protein [Spirochaetaceae bacterium]
MEQGHDTCIIACETLKQELLAAMEKRGCGCPVTWVDSGKHAWPDKLRVSVQGAIDGVPPSYKTVLLLFGFCGNAMVDIEARNHRLVMPKAADCIPLFIGSRKGREAYGARTYFFTEGYLNSGGSTVSDAPRIYERYGEKKGLYILKKMLGHYKDFAVIDTGVFDVDAVKARVEDFAEPLGIPVKLIPGSLSLIEGLLSGDWQEDAFLVLEPGGKITLDDSIEAGKSQNTALM